MIVNIGSLGSRKNNDAQLRGQRGGGGGGGGGEGGKEKKIFEKKGG